MSVESVHEVVVQLKERRPVMAERYKVKEIGLFGSFVRGEQRAGSDVDVLVEFDEDADLFDLIGLRLYLQEILQREVDVVPKHALRQELRETVLNEVIPV